MGTPPPETGLRIGILTVRDAAYHPNARLLAAAQAAGCEGMLIHPYRIWPATVKGRLGLIGRHAHRPPQVVLPRQGAEIGDTCLALIHHFQHMGIALINDHSAVSIARNKCLTLQVLLAAGLPCPPTAFVNHASGFGPAVDQVGGYPVVAKPVNARQGEGVMRIMDAVDARRRVLDGLEIRQGVMVQRYIPPAGRRDIRVLVIGGEAVCAARLTPRPGEFRANVHLGADIRPMELAPDLSRIGVAAAAAVGCDVAGVDMIVDADNRPLIVEVNYSPGFRGMEAASGLDIAGRIIRLAIHRYRTRPKANETDRSAHPQQW
jgi:ribosomal protein S6--L-glutamate ligase